MTLNDAIGYIKENATEPFQRYILRKEILHLQDDDSITSDIEKSKWYCQLKDEQMDDGSYGRFHSMDSASAVKKTFATTESAMRRMRDLGLTKQNSLVAAEIKLMERYLRNEDEWSDRIEKHNDNGKSHLRSRYFMVSADLISFDPLNPLALPFSKVCVDQIQEAFATGNYDDKVWRSINNSYTGTCLLAYMGYTLWLVQGKNTLDKKTERNYMNYLWNRKDGIYYVTDNAVSQKSSLEDKNFCTWLYALEMLSGFSLFGEFMHREIYDYLLDEIERLVESEVKLPTTRSIIGYYAESRKDKDSRKKDIILRILRILVRCNDNIR